MVRSSLDLTAQLLGLLWALILGLILGWFYQPVGYQLSFRVASVLGRGVTSWASCSDESL